MIHRMTNEERKEQFQQQLHNDAMRVVGEFLEDSKYDEVKADYKLHFEGIIDAINNPCNTLRTCAGEIQICSPVIAEAISNDMLFFQELHRAIKEGLLTEDML